jgi:micrococcal nuclease
MYNYKSVIVRWIDGDTVVLDIDLGFDMWIRNAYCRLSNIDTPETYMAQGYTQELKSFGERVYEFCNDSWPPGTEMVLVSNYDDSKDKYGRIMGILLHKDSNGDFCSVQESLLEADYAIEYKSSLLERTKGHLENLRLLQENA